MSEEQGEAEPQEDDDEQPAPVKRRHIPEPLLNAVSFRDPRSVHAQNISIVAFSSTGEAEEACDALCGARFLSSFYDLGEGGLVVDANGRNKGNPRPFRNAESAFLALSLWYMVDKFSSLDGDDARALAEKKLGTEDLAYSGHGSAHRAMWIILKTKFKDDSDLAKALLKTGDAFLLEHRATEGEKVWSNDGRGGGANWRGLMLMLIRDKLTGRDGWTRFITELVDMTVWTLKPDEHGVSPQEKWQDTVEEATIAVMDQVERKRMEQFAAVHAQAGFGSVDPSQQIAVLDARDVHTSVCEDEAQTPLQLAALGFICAWETGHDAVSVETLMDMVRWLEPKLLVPEKPDLVRELVIDPLLRHMRLVKRVALGVVFVVLMSLLFFSFAAMYISKEHTLRETGVIVAHHAGGGLLTAGTGDAVRFHTLWDILSLKASELRTVHDVAFSHQGEFSLYRLSGITQTPGGGLILMGWDGTRIWVEQDEVTVDAPFQAKTVFLRNETGAGGSWTASGLSREVAMRSWKRPT